VRLLTFPAGDVLVALPLAAAREIVPEPAITPLPTAPPAVLGLFDLHGEIVPLFDAAVLLEAGTALPHYAAVVACAQGVAAIATPGPLATVVVGERLEPTEQHGVVGTVGVPGRSGTVQASLLDLDVLFPEMVEPR
jgi:purine-binding chemotaxis protein CheW